MKEIWKPIIGYENKYEISNTGKIRSLNYNNTGKIKELKIKINKYGFCEVKLSKNNKTKDFMVARLVGQHFLYNPNFKEEVMHKNKNKLDNSVENLEWAYKSETRHNMYNKGSRKIGNPTNTKISYNGKNFKKYNQIAKQNGINESTFRKRMENNWSLYEAIDIPVGGKDNGSKL